MPIIKHDLTAILPIDLTKFGYGERGDHVFLHGCYFSEYYGYEIVATLCDEAGNRFDRSEYVWQSNHETYDGMVQKFVEFCVNAVHINDSGEFPEPEYYRGF